MGLVIVQTEDGRMLTMPRDEAEWVLGTARERDAITFWVDSAATMRGFDSAPQPLLLPRARCGLARRRS